MTQSHASTTSPNHPGSPADPERIRDHLARALQADLVGPFAPEHGDASTEILPQRPTRWYLTGFLTPEDARTIPDPTNEEEPAAGDDKATPDASDTDQGPKIKHRWPASLGMSALVGAGSASDEIVVTVRFARYQPVEERRPSAAPDAPSVNLKDAWQRVPERPRELRLRLDPALLAKGERLTDADGLWIVGKLGQALGQGLPAGARAVSVFLVNRQAVADRHKPDEACIFQVELEVRYAAGFLARPNLQGQASEDWDDNVNDLQFRDRCEWGVGHGVAVEIADQQDGRVTALRTTWLPRALVRPVKTRENVRGDETSGDARVETRMEALAGLKTKEEVLQALAALPKAYGQWIEQQRRIGQRLEPSSRAQTADALMDNADTARQRVAQGIALLADDGELLRAFQLANSAMATAALRRSRNDYSAEKRPRWRLFQLAFLLLNVAGLANPQDSYRDHVELIFFPTGGGKTEAYLAVIAFTLVLRRLRGRERPDRGLGVAVILRYTLRLLTFDQLSRASTLICALEQLRKANPGELGDVRFSIGLWVGRHATANTMQEVTKSIGRYLDDNSPHAVSPFPLTHCPWCGSLQLKPGTRPFNLQRWPNATQPERIIVGCSNWQCDFAASSDPEGLPVLFVDDQLYREPPSFIVATVDKFAMMPWRGEIGMLFGRVDAREGGKLYGPLQPAPKGALRLPEGIRPPELIVQDELHLISGPLGTMVGLYETAIDHLASLKTPGGHVVRPKILAATATVHRARQQVSALYGRKLQVFPPPGLEEGESFFAQVDRERPARLYLGVAAAGRPLKAILLRTYVSLLSAGYRQYDRRGPLDQSADGYTTLVGYFNSLRELGGMRRLVEDDVRKRIAKAEERKPLDWEGPHPWYRNQEAWKEPVELTSRESTEKVKASKARLNEPFGQSNHVSVLLASNMISVGIDIARLGLMVVAGQPKTTSEYIQATSRVGRDRKYPGLVVTCFGLVRPRDRSHYERFTAYHESFYRHVEANSVTPFAGPTLDRGLAGVLVAMTRLGYKELTAPFAAMLFSDFRALGEAAVEALVARAHEQPGVPDTDALGEQVHARARKLLDHWEEIIRQAKQNASQRTYSDYDRDSPRKAELLHRALDGLDPTVNGLEAHFVAPTSLRDVEPTVPLWLPQGKGA